VDLAFLLKILAAVAAASLLGWRISHAYRTERVARRHMLDGFASTLSSPRFDKGLQGLPRVRGALDGTPVVIALDSDTLALRTLPTLWLEARWAREHTAILDILLEPSGTEYFVEDLEFDSRAEAPSGWPDSAIVRVSGAEAAPILDRLARVDPVAFPALKYLLVGRRELRVTMKCARADRQTYRVLRSAKFKSDVVTPELMEQTLSALRTIEGALRTATEEG
jgi:hypothetical protein